MAQIGNSYTATSDAVSTKNQQALAGSKTLPANAIEHRSAQSLPEIWSIAAQRFGPIVAVNDPNAKPQITLTYADLYQTMQRVAAGLQALGVARGDRVAIFSDNSARWLIADQGVMIAGGVDAVRSSQADRDELLFILENSGSIALIVQDLATLNLLKDALGRFPLRFVALLSDESSMADDLPCQCLNFSQLHDLGCQHSLQPIVGDRNALATLIYTSGTSGRPKGVMLSHGNLLSQITAASQVITPQPGECVLSLLPSWHSYERTFEYFIFAYGCTQVYTSIRHIKTDLKQFRPHYMVGVPRIWESIYEGIQKQFREQPASKQRLINQLLRLSLMWVKAKRIVQNLDLENLNPSLLERLWAGMQAIALWPIQAIASQLIYKKVRQATGGRVKYLVSGGGSLAKHLDDFYEIIGIEILQGYGLTETSPITNVRRPDRNLRGSSGPPIPNTEIQIVDPETSTTLPIGQRGLILIRGPQVMQGYYQNPEATAAVIGPEGWFNSGDLGWVTSQQDLTITGRAKDTIVLTNGENIEPQPIEDACLRSPYIDQIMLVGQDEKTLGAIIVPNLDAIRQWAEQQGLQIQLPESMPVTSDDEPSTLHNPDVHRLLRNELNREVKSRPGYRPDDRIGPFCLVLEPFSIENGMLTQTLKIRRAVVMDRYRGMIDGMFT